MSGYLRKHKRVGIMLGFSALLLILLILEVQPDQLVQKLSQIDLGILVVVGMFFLTGLVLRAVRWQLLLRAAGQRVDLRTSFVYTSIGQALNDLTPIKVAGEASRIYGMNAQEGVPVGTGLATIVTERVMDLIMVTALVLVAVVVLLPSISLGSWTPLAFIVLLVALANLLLILVLRRPRLIERMGQWLARKVGRVLRKEWADGLEEFVTQTIRSFNTAILVSEGRNRRLTLAAVALTAVIWGVEFGRLYLIMMALGTGVGLAAVVVASTLSLTAQTFMPGGSANVLVISDVLSTTGIALATATAAGILSIVTSIWLTVPIAVAAIYVTGMRAGPKEST